MVEAHLGMERNLPWVVGIGILEPTGVKGTLGIADGKPLISREADTGNPNAGSYRPRS